MLRLNSPSCAFAARYTDQSLNRMETFDISVPIRTGMVTYPGDPQVRLERVASIADGSPANVSKLDFGVHSGTHIDAPVHFIEGAAGAEKLPLDVLLGPCVVVAAEGLSRNDVVRAPEGAERVLFKTPNSELWAQNEFPEEFASLDAEAAQLLVDRGVKLVGVDWLSVGDEDLHHPPRGGRRSDRRPRPARSGAGRLLPRGGATQDRRLGRRPRPRPAHSWPPGLEVV